MSKYNVTNIDSSGASTPVFVPDASLNNQFKRQTNAGIPRSNFLVYFLPSEIGAAPVLSDAKLISGCKTLSGLDKSLEEKDIGDATSLMATKVAGRISYANLNLERGFDLDAFLSVAANQHMNAKGVSDRFCFDIAIAKMTADGINIARLIYVKEAWIRSYKPQDMDSTSTDPWYESIEIVNHGWCFGRIAGVEPGATTVLLNTEGVPLRAPKIWDYYWDAGIADYVEMTDLNFFDINVA